MLALSGDTDNNRKCGVTDTGQFDEFTSLLDAITAVTEDADLTAVLQRIVEAACTLVDARYGALGVVGESGRLAQFVHTGLTETEVKRLGALPRGGGVLGVLLTDPQPIRLDDLSAHPQAGGFPANHPVMHTFLGAPIRVRGEVFGNLYLTEKRDGTPFSALDENRIIALSALAGAAIANTRQLEQLRERERWRDAVLQLAVNLLAGGEVPAALSEIAAAAHTLYNGVGACVLSIDDHAQLAVRAVSGSINVNAIDTVPVDQLSRDGIVGELAAGMFDGNPALWTVLDDGPVALFLGVGLTASPTPRDQAELASFAGTARLALARSRAAEDLAALERVAERERIGRDLHDTVIQELFATGLSLQALARRSKDDDAVVAAVNSAVDQIDATVKQIRSTIFSLHQPAADASVRTALMRVADELSSLVSSPIRVTFNGPIDTLIDETVAHHVVPVLREALTNVVKHANASTARVDVSITGEMLVLTVTDDGIGLVQARPDGHGLANMVERAVACGGTCEITATEQVGTTVTWQVPVNR